MSENLIEQHVVVHSPHLLNLFLGEVLAPTNNCAGQSRFLLAIKNSRDYRCGD
jgi:hypothetical protein